MTRAYQEHNRDIEQEGNRGIGEQSEQTNAVHVSHGHSGQLGKKQNDTVDDGARRGVVVERDERVHLEVGAAEQALNHDQTDSLEDDTSALEEESNHDELDLAHGCDDDTNDDKGDVSKRLQVDRRDTETPSSEEDSDRHGSLEEVSNCSSVLAPGPTYLEHLDKGNTQVEICLVTADQAHAEEDADGDNGSQVYTSSHGHLLP